MFPVIVAYLLLCTWVATRWQTRTRSTLDKGQHRQSLEDETLHSDREREVQRKETCNMEINTSVVFKIVRAPAEVEKIDWQQEAAPAATTT